MVPGNAVGGYVPGTSFLHRLDPRVKLTLLFIWTLALCGIEAWPVLLAVGVAAVVGGVIAGIPLVRVARNLAPLGLVLAVIVLAGALRFDGSGVWRLTGPVGIDPQGLERSAKMVLRIVDMVLLSLLLTATTTVLSLTEALLKGMAPLRRLGIPVDDLATMLSIAIRFIPVCGEQLNRVVMAQRARGARVGEGGPVRRVVSWVPVMIPLFVGLFRRSDALALSMASRCYRGEGRTCLATLHMRPIDGIVLAGGVLSGLAAALLL